MKIDKTQNDQKGKFVKNKNKNLKKKTKGKNDLKINCWTRSANTKSTIQNRERKTKQEKITYFHSCNLENWSWSSKLAWVYNCIAS